MDGTNDIKALYIIINAGYSDEVMDTARKAGAKGATIMNARGEGTRHTSVLGISVDLEKEILLILIDTATADKIMLAVKDKFGVDSPAHGVCFTMPVDRTSQINVFPNGD